MSDRLKTIIAKESVQTLEKLAFIFATPEDEDIEPEAGETVDVAIRFTGPFSGGMLLLYPEGDLHELAANMLGWMMKMKLPESRNWMLSGKRSISYVAMSCRRSAGRRPCLTLRHPS